MRKMKNCVSVFDRGFLYGDGLFETMRSYGGRIFKLDEHLSRLFRSSKVLKIKMPYSKKELKRAVHRDLKAARIKDAYIRLTLTRGEGTFNFKHDSRMKPNVVVTVKEFKGYPDIFYFRGISAKISDIRQNEYSPLSGIKSLNFLDHIIARMRAQDEGFYEAILTNTKGHVAEAATSNIFLVKRGMLLTPSLDSGILPGITRRAVIRIARKLGIRVAEKAITQKELAGADEIFLTNSLGEIFPVVRVGKIAIGNGLPGEMTKLLHAHYKKVI